MGLMDKFKYLIGADDMDEEYEEEVFEEPEAQPRRQENAARTAAPQYTAPVRDNKVVELKKKNGYKLIINEPVSFDDCSKIVDSLKENKPIVLNLGKLETAVAKRIFDFASGAAYALDGSVSKVETNIFVFAPENVNVSTNIEEFKTLSRQMLFDE